MLIKNIFRVPSHFSLNMQYSANANKKFELILYMQWKDTKNMFTAV